MGVKMLVIDDTRFARLTAKKAIGELRPDWEIDEAADGEEGLKMADETSYDVIFIDVNMPGIDGLEVSTRLRASFPDTPMALVTANIQNSIQEHASGLNISVIGKPINADKLRPWLDEAGV